MSEELSVLSISESLWWVVPGQLAGVRKPTASDLSKLQDLGIQAIVSVLSDDSNLELYEQRNIPHLWLPIEGGTAPSVEQVQDLSGFVATQNALGHGVAVHCSNGRRRTGTLLTAYLIQLGQDYPSAISIIQAANPVVELRTKQIEFLQQLAEQPRTSVS